MLSKVIQRMVELVSVHSLDLANLWLTLTTITSGVMFVGVRTVLVAVVCRSGFIGALRSLSQLDQLPLALV
jgi:hypothetical protein